MSGKVEKTSNDHEKHKGDITCLAFVNGYLFSGGQDGFVKIWDENLNLKPSQDIYSSIENPIQALFCHGESIWAGDGVGNLFNFENFERAQHFEMVEEIKGLAIDDKLIYTIRDNDLCISEIIPERGLYIVKAVVPGKSPLKLFGAYINAKRSLLATVSRDGKGINVLNNCPHRDFVKMWHIDNAHETIINALSGNENTLFSGSYNGTIKVWSNVNDVGKLYGELNIGSCINSLCHGPDDHTVFAGTSDGKIKKVVFS
ncbi:uncharacterized protein LOC129614110 [Condylostylus longicornis]|uniref:uncharacterized protein LOC129614110 n=1 Tax=Condylostylus longicornis TaxID=2530218 RepID=UPI00244DDE13|nr:uncharacterized protein LOC129614110 [Condylostylus longicornis]